MTGIDGKPESIVVKKAPEALPLASDSIITESKRAENIHTNQRYACYLDELIDREAERKVEDAKIAKELKEVEVSDESQHVKARKQTEDERKQKESEEKHAEKKNDTEKDVKHEAEQKIKTEIDAKLQKLATKEELNKCGGDIDKYLSHIETIITADMETQFLSMFQKLPRQELAELAGLDLTKETKEERALPIAEWIRTKNIIKLIWQNRETLLTDKSPASFLLRYYVDKL